MNIAGLLLPKSMVAYLYDDFTLRQGLEKMKYHGYSSIPVISRADNRYVGTVSEGDFLWYFVDGMKCVDQSRDIRETENRRFARCFASIKIRRYESIQNRAISLNARRIRISFRLSTIENALSEL